VGRTDGTIPGSRVKGDQWELSIRGSYVYFPLCEYEAMRNFKAEVERLGKDAPLPDPRDFYQHTNSERVHPINRRSTMLDALDWYVQSGYASTSRAAAVLRTVRKHQITAQFGELTIARCDVAAITQWVVHLYDTGYSDSVVTQAFETLHRVWCKLLAAKCPAVWDDEFEKVSLDGIRKRLGVERKSARIRNWKPWSVSRMVDVLAHFDSLGDQCAFVLMAFMGLRISAAVGCCVSDVNVEERTLRVRGTKTDAALRIVPLPAFVFEFLDAATELAWGKSLTENWIDHSLGDRRWCTVDPATWRLHFYKVQTECGIEEEAQYWPHALRRWFLNKIYGIDDVELLAISVFAGHEVAQSVLRAGSSLTTLGCYIRELGRGLTHLADSWDDAVVTDVGFLIPRDGQPYVPAEPIPDAVTLQQAAIITGETPALMRFMARDGRFRTARKVTCRNGRTATREMWVIDEVEVRQYTREQAEARARSVRVSELACRYGVCHQTVMEVVISCGVPHQKVMRKGKETYAIDREAFDTAAIKMGLDRVAHLMLRHQVAAELDCPRKEVDWLVAQNRLEVERLPFDTRGTKWITRASVAEEKARRTKHRTEHGPCLTAGEVAELLGCTRATVYHLRRTGALSAVTDAKNRIVTPSDEVEKILNRQRTQVSINEAAALLGGSRGIVERYIQLGLLHPVIAPGPGTRKIRLIFRDEIVRVRESSAYLNRRRRPKL
jgi:integrase